MTLVSVVSQHDPAALVFDLDGTLVDTKAVNRKALFTTFGHHGVRPEDMPSAPEGTGFVDWCALLVRHGLLPADVPVAELRAECERETLRAVDQVREIGPVADLARWGHGRLPMAVATGNHRSIVDGLLAATGLDALFAAVVTRDDVDHGKPAPDLFAAAADALGIAPEKCLALEDTEVGLESARAAGMAVVDVRPYRATA